VVPGIVGARARNYYSQHNMSLLLWKKICSAFGRIEATASSGISIFVEAGQNYSFLNCIGLGAYW